LIKFYRFKPNIEKAQAKQKNNFAKRKNKGVRVSQLSLGDLVLRKVMKNISRKGGKLDACGMAHTGMTKNIMTIL
jgi:hypothetical protein